MLNRTGDAKQELKELIKISLSGSVATVAQVCSFMWMRTIMNHQYYHGGTFKSTFNTLYKEGGVRRLYKGFGVTLLYVPMCRFGDILTNVGTVRYLNSNPETKDLSFSTKTFCGTLLAGVWRVGISPIDAVKNSLQVNGRNATKILRDKIKTHGMRVMYHGSPMTFMTCVTRDYPWFTTYNYLNLYFDTNHKNLTKTQSVVKNAFTGLVASGVTDALTNSLQIVKIIRQTQSDKISYQKIVEHVVQKDGVVGLFIRGLKTRLLTNGIQGMMFSVLWNLMMQQE
ncbi:hypothetical protein YASMINEVIRUS_1554 [Yasminevirus sp. GU-2018]|uniref:Mitochondrial carrier protein n=1 Tax=Yasminevirus sp. GU-2018 TaxID=2420051 RepID=A0A5K0UBH7_9VIRU|nr:hypothetical protein YASMINEVIRUS_1554 [Yasminevirus sp. GU-2018]